MAYYIQPAFKFGSHLPILIKALSLTHGPALEMGMGMSSSIVMHWMCATEKRQLVSYENSYEYWRGWGRHFERGRGHEFHKVVHIKDWSEADIEHPWDVAFLDHNPAERRKEDIKRLANLAQYIIIHDSEGRRDKGYRYSEIYSLFKWRYNYTLYLPQTTILSNFVDLRNFSV